MEVTVVNGNYNDILTTKKVLILVLRAQDPFYQDLSDKKKARHMVGRFSWLPKYIRIGTLSCRS
jgi:hypothetical protein